jgi:hypothetical protein
VAHGKQNVEEHGKVTPEYVDYARRDVLATAELLEKLLVEFDRHPLALAPTRAFSPASIGKAYLRAMGIRPPLERQPGFQLVSPYADDPGTWLRLDWIHRCSGQRYRITTADRTGGPGVARVQTYRDVLEDFVFHPEAKSAGPDGMPCGRATVGLLGRRVVRSLPELTTHVGKESNLWEAVEAGLEHDPDEVWTAYANPNRDPWPALVLPVLKRIPAKRLAAEAGLAVSTVKAARNGHTLPHGGNREALTRAAGAFARERLEETGIAPPFDDLAACTVFLKRSDRNA